MKDSVIISMLAALGVVLGLCLAYATPIPVSVSAFEQVPAEATHELIGRYQLCPVDLSMSFSNCKDRGFRCMKIDTITGRT